MQTCVDFNPNKIMTYNQFNKQFSLLKLIDYGNYGYVYKILDNDNNKLMASKIGEYEDLKSDINIGCMLEPTKIYTSCINIPTGIISTDFIANNYFSPKIEIFKRSGLVIMMELLGPNLDSFEPKENLNIIELLFELYIAIRVLSKMGIVHNDLRTVNLCITPTEIIRVYNMNENEYIVHNKYKPVIIDFGISKKYDKPITDERDWRFLLDNLSEYFNIPEEFYSTTDISKYGLFDDLIDKPIPPGSQVQIFAPL